MRIKVLYLLILAGTLSSCAHIMPYQSSGITPPAHWKKINPQARLKAVIISDEKAQVEQDWWKHFKDSTLDELIRDVLKNNKNLGIARARVQEARSNFGFAQASQMPDIEGGVTASRGRSFGAGSTLIKPRGDINPQVQASWDIDVFGRNLPELAQIKELWQYADASQQAVLVGLLAEVGRDYFDLRNYQEQIEITIKNLDIQKKTLALIKAQQKGAIASGFDVERASAQVSTTEAKLPALKGAYETVVNRINVLLGEVPGTRDHFIETRQALEPLDQQIIVAAPAAVLANRPDVKAAERQFAASISARQYAFKQFFPDISLLSFYGIERADHLTATPWSVGLTLVQPIIDFGRIKAQLNVADAQGQEAFLSYQEKVLEAVEEMENDLTNYKNEVVRNGYLRNSVEENRKAAELARQQFKSGFIGLLDLLVAQGNVLAAESDLADSDTALRVDLVNIYTASGGGWLLNPDTRSSPQV
jgi:NodT family efflux transporter outer membrane factor (OMF) lipoprotein